MDQVAINLQSDIHFQSSAEPSQNVDFHALATQQVKQVLGLDPNQVQLATLLASLQIKAEHQGWI